MRFRFGRGGTRQGVTVVIPAPPLCKQVTSVERKAEEEAEAATVAANEAARVSLFPNISQELVVLFYIVRCREKTCIAFLLPFGRTQFVLGGSALYASFHCAAISCVYLSGCLFSLSVCPSACLPVE